MSVICEKCGETRGLFHKCKPMVAGTEAAEPMVENISMNDCAPKAEPPNKGTPQHIGRNKIPKAVDKEEYARKMEIEAVKQMVDAPDNHEAVQDSEIKQIVETMQMMSEKMSEYEARIVQLEAFNVAAEEAWQSMAADVDALESFAGGIRFERGAEKADLSDL